MGCLASLLVFIVVGLFTLIGVDYSRLTPHSYNAQVVDKWHEELCPPIYDDKGNYLSEVCGDDYTVILLIDGNLREEIKVSGDEFREIHSKDKVVYKYQAGKLGFKHDVHLFKN